jgi:hypothetical protein
MPYNAMVRRGFGSRSWHIRIAMEMLGKLKAAAGYQLDERFMTVA